VILQTLER